MYDFPMYLIKIIPNFGSFSSHPSSLPAGCPKSSCLSPILYNLYTYDCPQLNYCTLSIIADDTVVLSSELLASDVIDNLQRALNELHCYFRKWRIELNPDKTQAIYFKRKHKTI